VVLEVGSSFCRKSETRRRKEEEGKKKKEALKSEIVFRDLSRL